jgi:RND superfamily putative drug exporter
MTALATIVGRRAKAILVLTVLVALAAAALGGGVANRLAPFGADDPHSESVAADRQLERAGYRQTDLLVLLRADDPRTGAGRAATERLTRLLRRDPDVATVAGYLTTGSPAFLSRDGRETYLAVGLRATDDKARQDAAARIAALVARAPHAAVGGPALAERQINAQVEHDLRAAELYAFPLLFLLSLLFFRSLVAALLPLVVGGLAILGALLVLRVAASVGSISIFALNVATGLGLGLAIDYSLFVINRYREEVARSGPGIDAIRRTLATAGRTVAFSSITVAGALASLLVFPQRFLYSMGIGGAAVALVAAAVALVVLPALLVLLGERIDALSPRGLARRAARDARPAGAGAWYRLARLSGRAPAWAAVVTAALLAVVAAPALGMRFTSPDAGALPASASARQVADALRAHFPPYRDTPITVAVTGSAESAGVVAGRAARLEHVAAVTRPQPLSPGTYAVQVVSNSPPLSSASLRLVRELRALPGDGRVTGTSAHFLDLERSLERHLPYALLLIGAVTLIVLFAMTGSVLLPLEQLLMNALGLAATLGLLVTVFQHGRLQGLLGYTGEGGLDPSLLLLVCATVFGLSTDYGVFVVSRIKEARDNGASDEDAIALGLERTGRIVTSAALLFAVAFGAFLTSKIIVTKELGFGTAAAVLIDASIVRGLLVPALMHLLGRWSWWAPAPLRRLHLRVDLGEA